MNEYDECPFVFLNGIHLIFALEQKLLEKDLFDFVMLCLSVV